MPVNSQHREYKAIAKKWDLVRSVVKNDAKHLIRVVDPDDPNRSEQYKQDAILTNFTRLTKDGLTGLVFKKESLSELPIQISYLEKNSTGNGFSLNQLTQLIIGDVLQTSRYGLLVDPPQENENETEKLARIRPYNSESIINWEYTDFGNEYRLSKLVLKETVNIHIDEFEKEEKDQYRVLRLVNIDGDIVYQQELYNHDLEPIPGTVVIPTDYNGNTLSYIPFSFIGSENNDAHPDNIPLYDLAVVNIGHYKASADLMESMFICGQPVPVFLLGETSQEQFDLANKGGVTIGSRTGVTLGNGGDFKFAQVSPNSLPQQVMMDLEKQAAAIGARLISPAGGRETAEAAKIRYGSQNSVLHVITKNVSKGLEEALWWAAMFMMENPKESTYILNDQFYEEKADPNLIAQQIMLLDRGLMTGEEIRDNLKRAGVKLDKDFQIQVVDPMQGVEDDLPDEEDN